MPKSRWILNLRVNAQRIKLESWRHSQLLEMPEDSVMKMLEQLLSPQETDWGSFMAFLDPEFISISWERES